MTNEEALDLLRKVVAKQSELDRRISELADRQPVYFSPCESHRLIELESILRPYVPIGERFVRVGGYVMVDSGLKNVAVYNFGVGSEVSWDQDMANRFCLVYRYDNTIVEPPTVHGNIKYSKLSLGAKTEGKFISLADALKSTANNHQTDMILNIDIEGAEWDVLPALSDDDLSPFSQIVIELHGLLGFVTNGDFRSTVNDAIARLTADHTIVHVHANNYGQRGIAGQVMGFDVLELTLVRSNDWQFAPFRGLFPSELDAPNDPDKPEYPLGQFGFLRPITG